MNAYGEGSTTYLTSEFNDWNKTDAKCHMTYSGMQGNNWQFDSDYAVTIKKNQKFNFVVDGNTLCPNLMTNSTDFTHPADTDYLVASADITVRFFLQIYGESASWLGLYWYADGSGSYDADKNRCLESWCYDFVELTGTICDGTDKDNEDDLKAIWEDLNTDDSTYYLAGTFNEWNEKDASYKLGRVGNTTKYRINNVKISDSGKFKVTNGTWDSSWPESDYYVGNGYDYYTVEFDSSDESVVLRRTTYKDISLKKSYNALSSGVKAFFTSSNTTPKIKAAYERYVHIVNRYSSLSNFANVTTSGSNNVMSLGNVNYTPVIIIVSSIALVSVLGAALMIKRRKSER